MNNKNNLFLLILSLFLVLNIFSQKNKTRFEFQYLNIMKAEKEGKCFLPIKHTTSLVDLSLPSKIRYDMRKEREKKVGEGDQIKKEVLYKYLHKNDYIIVVDHIIKDKDCSSGELKKRELFVIAANYSDNSLYKSLYKFKEKPSLDDVIEKKVKSSTHYLWWKNDRYIRYEIVDKSQPFTDQNKDSLLKQGLDYFKSFFRMNYDEEERKKILKNNGGSVGGVRG